jgi:NAD+ synthase (glutamine-hydrolysing)
MKDFGLARITVCSPEVKVGNPVFNAKQVADMVRETPGSQVYLFPELCLTGYTCADLFNQSALLEKTEDSLLWLSEQVDPNAFVVVGLPVKHDSSLFNCAAVIHAGKVIGIIPKQHLPTYKEFYERRWFAPATGMETKSVKLGNAYVAFGIDLLFEDENHPGIIIGIEICEDIWTVIPPSSYQALAGATIMLNLSASNETVGKAPYRRDLVLNQSGRCVGAYAYASSGWTESTTDLVFGGHCMIAENGSMLAESEKFQRTATITADVCIEKLVLERERTSSFADNKRRQAVPFRIFRVALEHRGTDELKRFVNPHPFVPSQHGELQERC